MTKGSHRKSLLSAENPLNLLIYAERMSVSAGATDTIVAVSTPPGRGGIGIVRLSGPEAREIAEPMLRLKQPLEPGRARVGHIIDLGTKDVLDEIVATYFAAPASYTSEDVVEIAMHGSPLLLDQVVRDCLNAGARLAEPGEFTQRAFLAGRLDLTQAEAVASLIDATTLQQARTASQQLGGGLSLQVQPVKRDLVELIVALEAGIDFAEDDIDLLADGEIARRIQKIEVPLWALEKSFAFGRLLAEGFRLAIIGRPNAGKSSLFNRLIGRDRAIVTAQPGTTRDPVFERMDIGGIPVELIDTAGLRATVDEAESYGIAKSRQAMADADVVLLVIAANEALHEEDLAVIASSQARRLIVVVNKIDLVVEPVPLLSVAFLQVSAITGTGVEELQQALLQTVQAVPVSSDTVPITNLRQHATIAAAMGSLRAARAGLEAEVPHEMLLLELHECLESLDALTGTTHTEEILRLIFSSFCIGK